MIRHSHCYNTYIITKSVTMRDNVKWLLLLLALLIVLTTSFLPLCVSLIVVLVGEDFGDVFCLVSIVGQLAIIFVAIKCTPTHSVW